MALPRRSFYQLERNAQIRSFFKKAICDTVRRFEFELLFWWPNWNLRQRLEEPCSEKTIRHIYDKFLEIGWVEDQERSGRPSSITEEKKEEIVETLAKTFMASIRRLSQEVNVSKSVVHHTMRYVLKYKLYRKPVRAWLNQKFDDRWIGRGGPISWAPRSPDLTPLDFFLWGHVKSNVYKTTVEDINDLKTRIIEEIQAINKKTLHNVFLEVEKRLNFCIKVHGGTFEQYLWTFFS